MSPIINVIQDIIRFAVSYLLQQMARALLIAAQTMVQQEVVCHGQ